jgi:hypothetical protein
MEKNINCLIWNVSTLATLGSNGRDRELNALCEAGMVVVVVPERISTVWEVRGRGTRKNDDRCVWHG